MTKEHGVSVEHDESKEHGVSVEHDESKEHSMPDDGAGGVEKDEYLQLLDIRHGGDVLKWYTDQFSNRDIVLTCIDGGGKCVSLTINDAHPYFFADIPRAYQDLTASECAERLSALVRRAHTQYRRASHAHQCSSVRRRRKEAADGGRIEWSVSNDERDAEPPLPVVSAVAFVEMRSLAFHITPLRRRMRIAMHSEPLRKFLAAHMRTCGVPAGAPGSEEDDFVEAYERAAELGVRLPHRTVRAEKTAAAHIDAVARGLVQPHYAFMFADTPMGLLQRSVPDEAAPSANAGVCVAAPEKKTYYEARATFERAYDALRRERGTTTYQAKQDFGAQWVSDHGLAGFVPLTASGGDGGRVTSDAVAPAPERLENNPIAMMSVDIECQIRHDLSGAAPADARGFFTEMYQIALVQQFVGDDGPRRSWVLTHGTHIDSMRLRPDEADAVLDPTPNFKKRRITHTEYTAHCMGCTQDDVERGYIVVDDTRFYRTDDTLMPQLVESLVHVEGSGVVRGAETVTHAGREYTRVVEGGTVVYRDLTWYTPKSGVRVVDADHEVRAVVCKSEEHMLEVFAEMLRTQTWSVLTGWNTHAFDIPMLVGRARYYKGAGREQVHTTRQYEARRSYEWRDEKNALLHWTDGGRPVSMRENRRHSKQRGCTGGFVVHIPGRVALDAMTLVMDKYRLVSYSLSAVATHFFGDKKVDIAYAHIEPLFRGTYEPRGTERWYNATNTPMAPQEQAEHLAYYCWKDTWLVLRILQHQKLVDEAVQKCRVTGAVLRNLAENGMLHLVYEPLLKMCRGRGVAIPDYDVPLFRPPGAAYGGGLVLDMQHGYHTELVMVLDFMSLYPTIIMAYNICYTTIVPRAALMDVVCAYGLEPQRLHASIRGHEEGDLAYDTLVERHFHHSPNGHYFLKARRIDWETRVPETALLAYAQETLGATAEKIASDVERARILREFFFACVPGCACGVDGGDDGGDDDGGRPAGPAYFHPRVLAFEGVLSEFQRTYLARRLAMKGQMAAAFRSGDPRLGNIYNLIQLAFKLLMNSLYGFLGAVVGRYPDLRLGAAVTAYGQELNRVSQRAAKEHLLALYPETYRDDPAALNCTMVYGDSVSGDTPVIVRRGDTVSIACIRSISETWVARDDGKEYGGDVGGAAGACEVWSSGGWTHVRNVIRHRYSGVLCMVRTGMGLVCVTPDHSLLRANGECVRPAELGFGDGLLHEPPHSTETHVWITDPNYWSSEQKKAALWGAFLAAGAAEMSLNGSSWLLHLTSEAYVWLNKYCDAKLAVKKVHRGHYYYTISERNTDELAHEYRRRFYASGERGVPCELFSSSPRIVSAFLMGFLHVSVPAWWESVAATMTVHVPAQSPLIAQGILVLYTRLGVRVTVGTPSKEAPITLVVQSGAPVRTRSHAVVSISKRHVHDVYVYDLSTANEHFQAGVGWLVVHNTDSIMVRAAPVTDLDTAHRVMAEMCDRITLCFPFPVLMEPEKVFLIMMCRMKKKYAALVRMYSKGGFDAPYAYSSGQEDVRKDFSRLAHHVTAMLVYIYTHCPNDTLRHSLFFVNAVIADLQARDFTRIPLDMLVRSRKVVKSVYAIPPPQYIAWLKWRHYTPSTAPDVGSPVPFLYMRSGDVDDIPAPVAEHLAATTKKSKDTTPQKPKISFLAFPFMGTDYDYGSRVIYMEKYIDDIVTTASNVLFPFVYPWFAHYPEKTAIRKATALIAETIRRNMAGNRIVTGKQPVLSRYFPHAHTSPTDNMHHAFIGESATRRTPHDITIPLPPLKQQHIATGSVKRKGTPTPPPCKKKKSQQSISSYFPPSHTPQ